MRARWGTVLLLAAFLALPLALASEGSGLFTTRGHVTFPAGTVVTGEPLALLVPDGPNVHAFTLTAPRVHVRAFEDEHVTVSLTAIRSGGNERSWDLANVTMTLDAANTPKAFIGFYPSKGSSFECGSTSATTANVASESEFSSSGADAGAPDNPGVDSYWRKTTGPHVRMDCLGQARYDGPGAIKVFGLNLTAAADSNTTTLATGESRPSQLELKLRWLYVEFQDATIQWGVSTPTQVALASVDSAAGSGTFTFTAVSGQMRTADAAYGIDGRAELVRMDGDLVATARPIDASMLELSFQGDVHSTTLKGTPVATSPLGKGNNLLWLLAAGLVVAAGGATSGLVLHRIRKSRAIAVEVRAHVNEALGAAENDDWHAALDEIRAARILSPADAQYALEEATYLWNLNMTEEALRAYSEASQLAGPDDGEPDYWAAVRYAQLGNFAQAEAHLRRAFARDAAMCSLVEEEPLFGPLLSRPLFRALVVETRRHLQWDRAAQTDP